MTFEEEAKKLLDKLKEKDNLVLEKYKNVVFNQLDGSPRSKALEKNKQWYLKELEKLKEKYADTNK